MNLENCVGFVTGGSGGLGSTICKTLAANGVDVVIGYCNNTNAAKGVAGQVRELGRKAIIVDLDQTKPESIEAAVDTIVEEMGRLDILVNNAAWNIAVPFQDLDALTPDIWDRIHHTNLRGPFLVSRACAPHLRKSGNGRIVNISAFIGLSPEGSSIAHATAKGGLIHLSRCLAVAMAPDVTVNSVAPGLMEGTTMFNRIPSEATEKFKERAILKRHTQLQDVADQVITFCKADSVTGQVLVIDGGLVFH
jgi:3-oxoacyl-[acyl-carrier protein] reductase